MIPDVNIPRSREWIYWGVAECEVGQLPAADQTDGNIVYTFTAEHDPIDVNYSHTELRVYKNGNRATPDENVNKHVKKRYRIKLAERLRLKISPLK